MIQKALVHYYKMLSQIFPGDGNTSMTWTWTNYVPILRKCPKATWTTTRLPLTHIARGTWIGQGLTKPTLNTSSAFHYYETWDCSIYRVTDWRIMGHSNHTPFPNVSFVIKMTICRQTIRYSHLDLLQQSLKQLRERMAKTVEVYGERHLLIQSYPYSSPAGMIKKMLPNFHWVWL